MLYGHFKIFVREWSLYLSALSARLYLLPYLLSAALNIKRTQMTYFENSSGREWSLFGQAHFQQYKQAYK